MTDVPDQRKQLLTTGNVVVIGAADADDSEFFVIHAPRGITQTGYPHGVGNGWSHAQATFQAIRIAAEERAQFLNYLLAPKW